MDGEWLRIESAPHDLAVDVFYRNTTFTPPTEGVLLDAKFQDGFWRRHDGAGVPAMYVTSWRPTTADLNPIIVD